MERRINNLNHLEFRKLVEGGIDTVLIPVGTIEAHGITPLGTDVIIPEAMAERIAPDIDAMIAPAVPYGITRGLVGHPGTIRIRPETFKAYIEDILESLAAAGLRNLVVLNGHGGQTAELKDALFEAGRRSGARTLLIEWWYDIDEIREEKLERTGGHAGADETACVMAVEPSLVKPDLFDEKQVAFFSRSYSAYPVPGSIVIYTEGDWSLNLDRSKCEGFFEGVSKRVTETIQKVIGGWNASGI
jgi:creatinine amidohydrolase